MIFYMTFLSVVFLISLPCLFSGSKLFNSSVLLTVIAMLILFSGLRLDVGFDYDGYFDIFNSVKKGIFPSGVESGFLFYVHLFSDYVWLIFFTSLFTLTLKGYVIHRLSPFSLFSLAYYVGASFFLEDMGQIRQSLAIAIGVIGCLFCLNRSWFYAFVLFTLAAFFHLSCLVFFLIPVLAKMPFDRITGAVFLVIVTPILSLIGFNTFVDFLIEPLILLSPGLASKYLHYSSLGWFIEKPPFILSFGDFWRIFICSFCLIFWRSFERNNKFGREMFSIFLLGTVVQPMLRDIDGAARIVRPLLFFEAIVSAQLLVLFKGNIQKAIISVFVFLLLLCRSSYTLRDPRFSEYKSIIMN